MSGRNYVVPIDFAGQRWVKIPHGEVAWRLRDWDWRGDTARFFEYARVRTFAIGICRLSARSRCHIRVDCVRALREIDRPLANPILRMGGRTLSVRGTIPAGHHFIIAPDLRGVVYDRDWRRTTSLTVTSTGPQRVDRRQAFACDAASAVWLEIGLLASERSVSLERAIDKRGWASWSKARSPLPIAKVSWTSPSQPVPSVSNPVNLP
jgi:hypothetical protein